MSVSRKSALVVALALTAGSSTTFAFNTGGRTAHATSRLSNSPYGDEYDEQVPQQKKGFFQVRAESNDPKCGSMFYVSKQSLNKTNEVRMPACPACN